MATGTINRFTTGLFYQRRGANSSTTNTITPANPSTPQWFLLVSANQRAAGDAAVAVLNTYNGGCTFTSIANAGSWTATMTNGVITITKPTTYLSLSVFSDIAFEMT